MHPQVYTDRESHEHTKTETETETDTSREWERERETNTHTESEKQPESERERNPRYWHQMGLLCFKQGDSHALAIDMYTRALELTMTVMDTDDTEDSKMSSSEINSVIWLDLATCLLSAPYNHTYTHTHIPVSTSRAVELALIYNRHDYRAHALIHRLYQLHTQNPSLSLSLSCDWRMLIQEEAACQTRIAATFRGFLHRTSTFHGDFLSYKRHRYACACRVQLWYRVLSRGYAEGMRQATRLRMYLEVRERGQQAIYTLRRENWAAKTIQAAWQGQPLFHLSKLVCVSDTFLFLRPLSSFSYPYPFAHVLDHVSWSVVKVIQANTQCMAKEALAIMARTFGPKRCVMLSPSLISFDPWSPWSLFSPLISSLKSFVSHLLSFKSHLIIISLIL